MLGADGSALLIWEDAEKIESARRQLAVGRPASNRVTLITVPTQLIFADGFE